MKLKRIKRPKINLRFFEGEQTTYMLLTIEEFNQMTRALDDFRDNVEILKKQLKKGIL
jgi:hypothetical protein